MKLMTYLFLYCLLGTLGPKQKQEITVTFTPDEAKVLIATSVVKFSGAEEGSKVLKMSAIGKYPFITINHERFDFETLLVGKVAQKDVILKNSSLVPANFTVEKINDDGKDTAFSIDSYSGIVPPNASFKITVKYVPTVVGLTSCT
jgi:cilia- and flagella-associated protein 65